MTYIIFFKDIKFGEDRLKPFLRYLAKTLREAIPSPPPPVEIGLTKQFLPHLLIIKLMQGKVKVPQLIISYFLYRFQMEWWFIKLHSCMMSNKAEPFNLIKIFPLLQLTPVTFRLTLPYRTSLESNEKEKKRKEKLCLQKF